MISSKYIDRVKIVANKIEEERMRYPNCIEIYLFGSFLRKPFPNDIDVLVVYDDSECDINSQIDIIILLIERVSNCPVDMTALSRNEIKQTDFLNRLNGNYIRII